MARKKMFKNLTKSEKLILWLESRGYVKTEHATGKYIALFKPVGMDNAPVSNKVYFVGKNGAFRRSNKGTITDSVSVNPHSDFAVWCANQEYEEAGEYFRRNSFKNDTWRGNIGIYGECVFTVVGIRGDDPVICIYEPQEHIGKRVAIKWKTGEPIPKTEY